MVRFNYFRLLLFVYAAGSALTATAWGQGFREAGATSAITWQRWEDTLISKKTYEQPYKEISLRVKYAGPGGESFTNYGFWEEGNIFKIRTAFPTPGTWTWQTTCSDTANNALHNKQGQVRVLPYKGKNPLYQKGFLKVSRDGRTLAQADNTPFLWMGDTGWYVFRKASVNEWQKYIDNRTAKDFTVIQIHIASSRGPAPNIHGQMPFKNNIPNKDFWQDLDGKVKYANRKGLVIYIAGLGASGKGGYLPAMNTKTFAQYITGRLAGSFVIFSPSMDAHYDQRNDELGAYLNEAGPRHLISQHVGTDLNAAETYHPKEYLDFTSLQSGHHAGNIEKAYQAARNWSSVLWHKNPIKPVINTEGMYDGLGNNRGIHWREEDVRRVGWLSWLSGALGYTYGAGKNPDKRAGSNGGLWSFNKNSADYDYWEKVMEWSSAYQMTYLKRFFEGIEWWRLQPAPELILNNPTDTINIMAAAKSITGDLLVAYLPDNPAIELDMQNLAAGLSGKWFNPVTGKSIPVKEDLNHAGSQKFMRPGNGDWVLLLKK